MDLTWQKFILGGLGLVATTVLTILITRLVNRLLNRRSLLIVEVRVNEVFKAQTIETGLKNAIRAVVKTVEEREKLPFWTYDIYTKYFASEQYLKLLITNSTPKKITGLSLSLASAGRNLVQIGSDGELVEVPGNSALLLGDLQPSRILAVNILASSLFPTYTVQALQKLIVLSSDEHVPTRYRFPAPDHIEYRSTMKRMTGLTVLWGVLSVGIGASVSMFFGKH